MMIARTLIAAFVACSMISPFATAQDPPALSPDDPKTISSDALGYFANARQNGMPQRYVPKKGETWANLRDRYHDAVVEPNRKALDRFADGKPTIKKYGGVNVYIVKPKTFDERNAGKILVYIHGGGFVFFSAANTFHECLPIASELGLPVYSIEYPLAPEHPFPAGINACVDAYEELEREFGASNICLSGVSAGGCLVISTVLEAKNRSLPLPAAVASLTPWADLTMTGDTYFTLDGYDPIVYREGLIPMAKAYAGSAKLNDPLVSPVFAEFTSDFPPTIIYSGTRDMMLSNSVRLHRAILNAGVDARLRVWDGLWHGFQLEYELPESKTAIKDQADFFRRQLRIK